MPCQGSASCSHPSISLIPAHLVAERFHNFSRHPIADSGHRTDESARVASILRAISQQLGKRRTFISVDYCEYPVPCLSALPEFQTTPRSPKPYPAGSLVDAIATKEREAIAERQEKNYPRLRLLLIPCQAPSKGRDRLDPVTNTDRPPLKLNSSQPHPHQRLHRPTACRNPEPPKTRDPASKQGSARIHSPFQPRFYQ